MQINISGHHLELTDAIKDYVEKKISKIEHKFSNITQVHVILKVEKLEQIAEAELHLAGGRGPIFAKSSSNELYKSIDTLADKLSILVTKHKEKLQNHDDAM